MESTIIDVGEIKIENPDAMTDDIVIKEEIDFEKIANETIVLELVPAFTVTQEVRDENNDSLSNAQDSYGRVLVKSESNSDVLKNSNETNIFNNSNIVIKCEDIKKENEEISVTNVPNTTILTGLVIKKEDGNNCANNIVSVKTEDGFKIEIKEEENETMLISSSLNIVKDLVIKQEFKSEKIDISNTDCDDSIVMKENQTDEEMTTNHVNNDDVLETPVVKKTGDSNEGNSGENDTSPDDETCHVEDNTPKRFRVDRSAIESVSKENQATELQSLEGISVYDQQTLEAGIRQQVEQELAAPGDTEPAERLETGDSETEMERQIRMGEMTPFGTTLNMATTPPIKTRDGLSEIEKYLQKQLELDRKKKKNIKSGSIKDAIKKVNENVKQKVVDKKDLNKRKSVNKDSGKKKKKEVLGTKSEDFVPCTEKPGPVPGETSSTCLEEASGSEYCPSDTDFINTSEDEKPLRSKEKTTPSSGRKRKLKPEKPYKIPEDWASDDSDWEYSDEEGNVSKNKRSKKELDDGDVDAFNRRIRHWEYEKRKSGDENAEKFHSFDGDFKIPTEIWGKLYNYQRVGVRWLWELDQQCCGGILGDEMGLGKTIQVIAFMAGLHVSQLKDSDTRHRGLGPSLIVCPTTVMHQWVKEFHTWYPPLRVAILHESGTFCGKQRSRLIGNMVQASGVLITSYTGATQHKDEILTRRWHYVVLDEGHKIRNPDAQITLMVKQLTTCHRIILSGSPMQNNLKELWSLFDFVFPGKLGTLPVFLEQFAVPITQGGYANASQVQVMTAFKCATVLKDTIAPFLLRRMKADVKCHVNLPEKNEQVLFCRLTDEQRGYYKGYVESGEVSRILEGRLKIFMGLINLRKICNHPDLYSGGTKLFGGDSEADLPTEERYGYWGKSGKMIVVETLLKLWHKQGHRVLIFTQSRQMLTILERFVEQASYKYLKLDGGTSIAARQPLINKFNQDTSYFVMLLTTRVGGLGVNLTGANRVLIYDPDWNPATDTQARERAWRIGQKQTVTVYRLITAGTIEEKMYHRQIFKQFLCNKVLKDPRQRRFFKSNDLYELFTLKETDTDGSTETAAIFAGTDSEVKLDLSKKYKHRKIDPRLTAEAPTVTYCQKKAHCKQKQDVKLKKLSEETGSNDVTGVQFTNEKIEQMKRLAQRLSLKCVTKTSSEKSNSQKKSEEKPSVSSQECQDGVSPSPGKAIGSPKYMLDIPSTSRASESESHKQAHSHKKKHKDKKSKRHKDAKFEGETIPHLVKTGETTSKENQEEDSKYATQDEYVLKTLFAKSGLQTAMKHDTIMEGGPADYALVEGEADRVAKQAVEKLKASRQECWRASSGVPSFTGINGARNFQSKPRFGNSKSSIGAMSTKELLDVIHKRNGTVEAKDADLQLVENIRDFVSSNGGTVNTKQIVERFEGRLPEGSSPLFKSLLSKICTFYRAPDKQGYWSLKRDFI